MVFASITFLWIFVPAVLILYYLLQVWKKQKMQNFLLLFASLLFYSFGEPRLILRKRFIASTALKVKPNKSAHQITFSAS